MSGARLVYVMGPSGAGKDTLLAYARERLQREPVLFAHRYITRADGGPENHVALSDDAFALRSARGLFALEWSSHALRYGIGIEIDQWLAAGCTVVINGSRAHLDTALARYPHLRVVHVNAAPHVLAARLAARGRETVEQIGARLARQVEWRASAGTRITTLDNSGPLDDAGRALVALLRDPR
jgi:ribose 1,5-bisphosphokinase